MIFNNSNYSNIKPLQTGSFSTVYRAWSYTKNDFVALKVINKEKCSVQAVQNEYDVMRRLSNFHPNICAMLDFIEDEESYTFVLEYCECGDMYDFLDIAKKNVDPSQPSLIQLDIQTTIKQLFSAICYAHSLGIAHRDLKPENILMTKDGNIKLADWGHATFKERSVEFDIGTDSYRAPETFYSREGYNTIEADYWSLGVTILFIIFGFCPFTAAINLNLSNPTDDEKRKLSDNTLQTLKTKRCKNFADYMKDPNDFINKFLFSAIIPDPENTYRVKPVLYVWQDLINLHKTLHLVRIFVATLICIDFKQRSLVECMKLCDMFWTMNSNDKSFVHTAAATLPQPIMPAKLDNSNNTNNNTINNNSISVTAPTPLPSNNLYEPSPGNQLPYPTRPINSSVSPVNTVDSLPSMEYSNNTSVTTSSNQDNFSNNYFETIKNYGVENIELRSLNGSSKPSSKNTGEITFRRPAPEFV